jgi:hypothetical protein
MTDIRHELLNESGPIAVLCPYGLNRMLTEEDDPAL